MSTPIISIILPFYNAEKTLARALESISIQSFSDFECIMIDNNSTDNSIAIAKDFAINDKRFILTTEKTQGVVFASNHGSNIAKGKYIARMDSDDQSSPKRLELQKEFLDNNPQYGAVSGRVEYIPYSERNQGFENYVIWLNSVNTYEEIFAKRFIESPIANPSAMWRKETAIKNGNYKQGDFPEDYEMWLRWLHSGVKIGKVKETILRWYDSENRLTRNDSIYSNDSFYKAKSPYLAKHLRKINPHYPIVAIWGAGKIPRKRAQILLDYGIEIEQYIDITKKRQISEKLIFYKDIPPKGEIFILVYVKQKEMRDNVEVFLKSRDYIEGVDYLLVS